MTVLHAGEIGRLNEASSILDTDDFTILRDGELLRVDAQTLADYIATKQSTFLLIEDDYTLTLADNIIYADATNGPIDVTLPLLADSKDRLPFEVKKIDSTANTVDVIGAGSETIDGQNIQTLAIQYAALRVHNYTIEWGVL